MLISKSVLRSHQLLSIYSHDTYVHNAALRLYPSHRSITDTSTLVPELAVLCLLPSSRPLLFQWPFRSLTWSTYSYRTGRSRWLNTL